MNLVLKWNQLIKDPFFRDAPYKVELNKNGQILMSPASNWHGAIQGTLAAEIGRKKKNGKVINECSILTRNGVRVADVAWASDAFIREYGFNTPYIKSPELCIEVVSPGNTKLEIEEKVGLYLEKGCLEVWVVDKTEKIVVYTNTGLIDKSKIAPKVKI